MDFTSNSYKILKSKWESGEKKEVIDFFRNKSKLLLELEDLDIQDKYYWIDLSTTVLITAKDFLQAEMIIKNILYHKNIVNLHYTLKANLYNKLGVTFGFRGAFQKAIECYQYVYDLALTQQDVSLFPRSCNNLGLNYMHLDKLSKAEETLMEGLSKISDITVDEDKNTWEIMLRGNLAELFRRKKTYKESINQANRVLFLTESKVSIREEELIEVQSETLKTLFLSCFEINDLLGIELVMDKINSLIFVPNSHFGIFYYFIIHGFYDWLIKKTLDSAVKFFRQSIELALKIEAGEFVYQAQLFLAQILIEITSRDQLDSSMKSKNLDEIERILQEVSSFSKSQKMFGVLAETHLLQAEFFRCTNRFSLAYQHLSYCNVLINSNNLNHLYERYDKIESRIQNQIEKTENPDINNQNIVSFEELLSYLAEIHRILRIHN